MDVLEKIIVQTLKVAFLAGKAIMDIYNQPFTFELKPDNSPLTIADQKAHNIISEGLKDSGLPILSEEGSQIDFDVRKSWKQYWLIDPLDGTKEFIKKNGDFTVNIAIISDSQPIFGVVYAPVPGLIYWGSKSGSFRLAVSRLDETDFENFQSIQILAERLPCVSKPEVYTVLGSKSHMNLETESFISNLQKLHPHLSFVSRGSSLKFCTLAEGGADIYPRFGPTMEWDTAAGQAVAFFAGCSVNQLENGLPVTYNKPSLLNPFFVAEQKKMR